MTRWPNSATPGVQPYNDVVRAELEDVLRQVVALGDRVNATAAELLTYRTHATPRSGEAMAAWVRDLNATLEPHTTSELDVDDLTYELLELIGDDPSDDAHND